VMIQFVPDTSKLEKEKGRGSLIVWIQQARGLQTPCDQGTYLQWSVAAVFAYYYANTVCSCKCLNNGLCTFLQHIATSRKI